MDCSCTGRTRSVASGVALMLFSRNPQTGELALLQTVSDSEAELGGATSVAVSPSGSDVYVASSNPGALAHFCVDESTGELQEVGLEEATIPTQLDLDGASLVTVNPENSRVLVASNANDTMWVLDVGDGECAVLELQDTIVEGDEGRIGGLADVRSIAVSPDGRTALVVSSVDGTIALFRDTTTMDPSAPTPAPTSEGGDPSQPPNEDEWYEQHALALGLGGAAATVAAAGLVWLLITNGCCGIFILMVRRKTRVECPACDKKMEVKRKGLAQRTACSCDSLRAKAEDDAGQNGGQSGKVLFHPDPRYIATCPHCGNVSCATCDVRDKKETFPFLLENNPEDGKEIVRQAQRP
ncbi:unnamed protein product [Ectocarpus fasciculatus]